MGVTFHYQVNKKPRFVTKDIVPDNLNLKIDKKKERIIKNRLKKSGPVTIEQYKLLWNEEAYITENIGCYVIGKIIEEHRFTKFSFLDDIKSSIFLYHKKFYTNHILHQYANIKAILDIREFLGLYNNLTIYFDKEIRLVFPLCNDIAIDHDIIPDAVFRFGETMICIETCLGTENDKIIRNKFFFYRKYLDDRKSYETLGVKKIKLYFCATENRISILKKKGFFLGLENYIRYFDI